MAQVLSFTPRAGAPLPEAVEPRRQLLGSALVEAGALAPHQLALALDMQREQDVRLGRILLTHRLVSADDLTTALERQSGLGRIDLAASPIDPDLADGLDPYRLLAIEAIPWRQIGGTRVIAIANPEQGPAAMEACGGGAERVALALAAPEAIRRAIAAAFRARLRDDALTRCPERYSCRNISTRRMGWRLFAAAGGVLAAVGLAPLLVLSC